MTIDLDIIMADFEALVSTNADERSRAIKAALAVLYAPLINQARIAYLEELARANRTALPRNSLEDYRETLDAIQRFGLAGALGEGVVTPELLRRLLADPVALQHAHERLAVEFPPDPQELARNIIDELRFTNLVPSSDLLTVNHRRELRKAALVRFTQLNLDELDLLPFLVAVAKAIREVRRSCARTTGKSGTPSRVPEANQLLQLLDRQDELLRKYEADEDLVSRADWFLLAEDAALEEGEVAELVRESPNVVTRAILAFRDKVVAKVKAGPHPE